MELERQELKLIKEVMTEKVQTLDAIDTNIAREQKNGELRIAQELAAKRFQVESSIVQVVRRWIQDETLRKAPILHRSRSLRSLRKPK